MNKQSASKFLSIIFYISIPFVHFLLKMVCILPELYVCSFSLHFRFHVQQTGQRKHFEQFTFSGTWPVIWSMVVELVLLWAAVAWRYEAFSYLNLPADAATVLLHCSIRIVLSCCYQHKTEQKMSFCFGKLVDYVRVYSRVLCSSGWFLLDPSKALHNLNLKPTKTPQTLLVHSSLLRLSKFQGNWKHNLCSIVNHPKDVVPSSMYALSILPY